MGEMSSGFRSFWVVGEGQRGKTRRILLEEGVPLSIGRAPDCKLRIPGRWVSKHHAELVLDEDGAVRLRDCGSRNGTYLCDGVAAEGTLVAGEVKVRDDQLVRIAGTLLVPCRRLAKDLSLSAMVLSQPPSPISRMIDTGPDRPVESAELALQAFRRCWGEGDGVDAWHRVMGALTALIPTEDGFVLSSEQGRFLLRARVSEERPYLLSSQFLETTLEHGEVTCLTLGSEGPVEMSQSMAGYRPGTVLVGVPLVATARRTVAVACLEAAQLPHERILHALAQLGELAGPVLEQALDLDRESRRREAAQRRLRSLRGEEPGSQQAVFTAERALVGQSPLLKKAIKAVRRAAPSEATILLRGPSGSGKELLARLVHDASTRSESPFVTVNCAAIPDELVESELFGHDKGSFTGAEKDHPGAFERAHGGTLFLDEVGELSPGAQAKVLRTLETGEVIRVGGSLVQVDVRVVAATHRDLEAMVAEGTFRADLYYRLRVIEVALPPLSQRAEDILPLAEHFLAQFRRPDGRRVTALSTGAARRLVAYPWPGNIRELRNVIERAVVLDQDGVLAADDLPRDLGSGDDPDLEGLDQGGALLQLPWKEAKKIFGEKYFRAALERHGGKVGEAAEAVGISRRALTTIIREHSLR